MGRSAFQGEGGSTLFGSLIVCYLFLGGAGAGACLAAAALGLLSPAAAVARRVPRRNGGTKDVVALAQGYRRLLVPTVVSGLAALGLGAVCLLADVGRIDRAELLLASPMLSYVAVGAWALVVCAALAAILAAAWAGLVRVSLAGVRVVEASLAATSLVVMAYTGLLLQSMPSVPLWATPWLPVLFVLSSLSCGCALALAAGQFSGSARLFESVFRRIAAVDAFLIAAEAVAAVCFVAASSGVPLLGAPAFPDASGSGLALAASIQALVAGADAWLFWGVFVVGGLAAPLVLDLALLRARALSGSTAALAAAACVLAGGFAIRFCVVEAGLHPALQVML